MRQPSLFGSQWSLALLGGCLSVMLASPVLAQTPSAKTSPGPVPIASPTPSRTVLVSPSPVESDGASTPVPSGQAPLVLPTPASDRQVLSDWRSDGTVGKSTFVDKIRKVTWTLALVCFAIWIVGKIAGRATLQKWGIPVEPDSLIEVIEKKRLSPGRSIMLVKVGPKVLAVAATESGYTTLTEIDAEALKLHQDERATEVSLAKPETAQSPSDIAKHYLSIIPGLGAKK